MLTRKYRSTTERKTDDAGAVMRRYGWICGAFAIIILLIVIEMKIISNASGYETREKVVVAARNIGMDAVITGDMLEIREISSGAVHRDAVRNIDEAVGMRAAADIYDGEVLLRGRLTEKESDAVEALNKSNRLFSPKQRMGSGKCLAVGKGPICRRCFVPNHLNQDGVTLEAPGVLSVPPAQTGIRMMKNIRIAGFVDEDGEPVKDGGQEKFPDTYCLR